MAKDKPKIIITGGGTGGHVFPAIAIANALRKIKPQSDILFVGAKGKLEMEKVPKAGFDIKGLWISGFQRRLTLKNLLFPFKLLYSLWKARSIIKRFKPDVAIGVGGYASGPTLEMALRNKVPVLVQEQNSYAGVTNRLVAKRADKFCVAYENMNNFFPKDKIVLTGNPVRDDILNIEGKREEAFSYFAMDEQKQTILVLGGSLGARTINNSILAHSDTLKNSNVQVLWQVGKLYIEEFEKTELAKVDNVKMTAFIDRMDLAYAMADIVISRAGALSISELCLVHRPLILVPSPNVAEDHQTKNAEALVEKDAAIMIKDINAEKQLVPKALALLKDKNKQKTLSQNITQFAKPNAAKQIAQQVLTLIEQ